MSGPEVAFIERHQQRGKTQKGKETNNQVLHICAGSYSKLGAEVNK